MMRKLLLMLGICAVANAALLVAVPGETLLSEADWRAWGAFNRVMYAFDAARGNMQQEDSVWGLWNMLQPTRNAGQSFSGARVNAAASGALARISEVRGLIDLLVTLPVENELLRRAMNRIETAVPLLEESAYVILVNLLEGLPEVITIPSALYEHVVQLQRLTNQLGVIVNEANELLVPLHEAHHEEIARRADF